jgi:hypothetical protein
MTPQTKEALEQMIEYFEKHGGMENTPFADGINACKEALKQEASEQKPVLMVHNNGSQLSLTKADGSYFDMSKHVGEKFYAYPTEFKTLTDDEIPSLWVEAHHARDNRPIPVIFASLLNQALKDKNHD